MMKDYVFKRMQLKLYQQPKKGQTVCGDSYYVMECEDYFLCVIADGLGSGPYAHQASKAVVYAAQQCEKEPILTIMEQCNRALWNERGAVVAIFKLCFKDQRAYYCTVGNIKMKFVMPNGAVIHPIPVPGYLSGRPQEFNLQTFPFEKDGTFIFHTDGLDPSFFMKKERYAFGLFESKMSHPSFSSDPIDDVTCIIGRQMM